jgi:archaellum component FlaC
MQVVEMKTKLEEKIRGLEKEKSMLLEEVKQLREVVELSQRAKDLESEIGRLKSEVRALKEKLPQEILMELGEFTAFVRNESEEEESFGEECLGCEEEELL